jgi:osmoprotectant transport system ATP-binding protein
VTHDISEAFALAGRIGVVEGGELLVYDAAPLVASSADPRVRAFIDAVPPRP